MSVQEMDFGQTTALHTDTTDFVTVVSVGTESVPITEDNNNSSFVTVLKIGDEHPLEVIEEVLVYRLPGERLGFGLKFDGGNRTAEFVKRLFIQSCAPDSPASRVRCSWGKLVVGDEILEIDSLPVKSMTRIDCVRCLKDSNVVIKLQVKHIIDTETESDLPQVISAEKKRVPPPPPPVPPRKVPRKLFKNVANTAIIVPAKVPAENGVENPAPIPTLRNNVAESVPNGNQINRFQSPRNSGRFSQRNGCEPVARDRRISDGSLGPPDPEVYTDLFSQESTCSLSESDDTGSSISTIVDRLGSYPTTTTSSLADSLPSTPTSIQRHLELNHLSYNDDEIDFDCNDNNYLFANLTHTEELSIEEKPHVEGNSLQPPTCFQDAPLSYGNENVRTTEYNSKVNNGLHNNALHENGADKDTEMLQQPPPAPPRTKILLMMSAQKNKDDSLGKAVVGSNMPELPRLVDFVPKYLNSGGVSEQIEVVKLFLENEKRVYNEGVKDECSDHNGEEISDEEIAQEDGDYYGFNWSNCSQLATIGEDEEEIIHDSSIQRPQNPIVIVESVDGEKKETALKDINDARKEIEDIPKQQLETGVITEEEKLRSANTDGNMDAPPTCSRQPPDGHEFPDYQEASITTKSNSMEESKTKKYWDATPSYLRKDFQSSRSVRDKIAIFSQSVSPPVALQMKSYKSSEDIFSNTNNESLDKKSVTSLDKDCFNTIKIPDPIDSKETRLHKRSQSLVDMSTITEPRNGDRWSFLIEQRKRGLSKLKGLVIPEPVAEDDGIKRPVIDIPEIKNSNIVNVIPIISNEPVIRNISTPIAPSTATPQWNPPNVNSIPKYSPAFKRKGLQIYSAVSVTRNNSINTDRRKYEPNIVSVKSAKPSFDDEECRYPTNLSLSDAPKSLESITSPTRSDCSFEYLSSSPELKFNQQARLRCPKKDEIGRSEDESDNDSAVSSSQSSYISRSSPPASPNHLHFPIKTSCNMLEADSSDRQGRTGFQQELQVAGKYDSLNRRLLKPQSVEAINRKNILASAKCRSGRDLKVGSPLIQRKFEEDENRRTLCQLNNLSANTSLSNHVPAPPSDINKLEDVSISKPSINTIVATTNFELLPLPAKQSTTNKKHFVDKEQSLQLPKIVPRNVKAASVTDLRKSFEQMGPVPAKISYESGRPTTVNNNTLIKSMSNAFMDVKRNGNVKAEPKVDVTKGTTHPMQKKSDDVSPHGPTKTIVLKPEFAGSSVGITLAGGTDYETKEITVHKVRSGSVASKDGRLKKGDKIISINGKSMIGLTHAESVAILKEKVPEITIVACDCATNTIIEQAPLSRRSSSSSLIKEILPVVANTKLGQSEVVTVIKDIAGLGFSVEGGIDSPLGEVPLRIKKIFAGGAAEKCGLLHNGDELLTINGTDVSCMSKMDAWNLMRKLPEGAVTLTVRR